MIPQLLVTIDMPDVLEGRGFNRVQNRSARAASTFALRTHKRETTVKHFQRGNRQRYRHKTRKNATIKAKRARYGRSIDLVKTGTSRELAKRQRPVIRHRGAFVNRSLASRYTLRLFNFPGRRTSSDGVNIVDMELEAGAIADNETNNIAKWWDQRYEKIFQQQLDRAPRLRKRFQSR